MSPQRTSMSTTTGKLFIIRLQSDTRGLSLIVACCVEVWHNGRAVHA
jgi:hypothetical protein